jgi:antitoxin VapB
MTKTTAKLFMHGRSQAVRLPKEFRMEGKEVEIWKEGEVVYLRPTANPEVSWKNIFAELKRLPDVGGFMEDRMQDPITPPPNNLVDEY